MISRSRFMRLVAALTFTIVLVFGGAAAAEAAPFVSDTFTGTSGTELAAHVGETGATWTEHAASTGDEQLSSSGGVRETTTTGTGTYTASGTPPSAAYTVSADFKTRSGYASDTTINAAILGRVQTGSTLTAYGCQYYKAASAWRVAEWNSGTSVIDATSGPTTLAASTTYAVQLVMSGTSITCKVNGTTVASATDSTITTAGKTGLRLANNPQSVNDGIHLDNFTGDTASTSCPAGSHIITSGQSISSGYGATTTGGTLCLNGGTYTMGATLDVAKPITILGVNGASITQTFSSGYLFSVSNGNVTLRGLKMTGANRNHPNEACDGTGGIVIGAVSSVFVDQNTINSFTCGIELDGTNTSWSVTGNHLDNIKYAAITTYPASNGTISGNTVTNLNTDGVLDNNAYGIVTSGDRSSTITITGNTVDKAPTWECYDNHDGSAIDFTYNTCIGPGRVGINIVNSGLYDPTGHADNNTISAGGLTSADDSIVHTGFSGTVNYNTITGFSGGSCLFYTPHITPVGNTCS